MRFLTVSFVVALALAVLAPGTLAEIKDAAVAGGSSLISSASAEPGKGAGKDYEDRDAHALACTLFRKWSKADDTTRKASAKAVAAIANEATKRTDDPAAKALLAVVPAAVGYGTSAPTRSAQLLLKRECRPAR